MRPKMIACAIALLLAAVASSATVIVVDHAGGGDYLTIQDGINAASEGDTVLVAPGTYTGASNRNLDFGGTNIVLWSQAGQESTIIDCELEGRGLYFHTGEDSTSRVDGFTITRGSGDGGGMDCHVASPTIENVTFFENRGLPSGGGAQFWRSESKLRHVVFDGNRASTGAAITAQQSPLRLFDVSFLDNTSSAAAVVDLVACSALILDCEFVGNTSTAPQSAAGGIYMSLGSNTIDDCLFASNHAVRGGAMVAVEGTHKISDCVFEENTGEYGGAVYCEVGSPRFTGCTFASNDATQGGATWVELGGTITFSDCAFVGNTALVAGAVGAVQDGVVSGTACWFSGNAAVAVAGAVMSLNTTVVSWETCTFAGNSAGARGGALNVSDDASMSLTGCTLADNEAPVGSGLVCDESAVVELDNTIIAFGVVGEAVYCEDAATAGLTCCDLFGNDGGDWVGHIAPQCGVGGNINENPLFCRDENPDEPYSLHDGSPCALVTNPTCGLIGAWDVGCAATAVRPATWGEIKASFR